MIFQLTQADVERFASLTHKDIGKWCFLVCSCFYGFYKTKKEAEQAWKEINR